MSTAQELSDLAYASALRWVPLNGGITEVERVGHGVLIYGGKPQGVLGMFSAPTCVQLTFTDDEVRAIILGGRPGIPENTELFARKVAGHSPDDVANEVVQSVSSYLAASTG